MKQTTLEGILNQLNEIALRKRDIVLPMKRLSFNEETGRLNVQSRLADESKVSELDMTDWATTQLCQKLRMPTEYFKRVPNDLRAHMVSTGINTEVAADTNVMLRTYAATNEGEPGLLRGLVSERYTRFDDDKVTALMYNVLRPRMNKTEVLRWERTDASMHLRVGFTDMMKSVGTDMNGKPDWHQLGFHITNSEVGKKAIEIRPMIYRLICSNGMMAWVPAGSGFRHRHIHISSAGMQVEIGNAIVAAVKQGDDTLLQLEAAKTIEVDNPIEELDKLAEKYNYSDQLKDSIKAAFYEEPGKSLFYLTQALTRAAKSLPVDRKEELESKAGEIIARRKVA